VPFQTAHRRFSQWTKAGLWRQLHHTLLDELGSQGLIDWSRAIVDGACVRAKKGSMTGCPQRHRIPPETRPTAGSLNAPCAWLTGYRRLILRYERKADHFLAFGTSLTCYKELRKLTT
jgi:transposase